MAARGPLRYRSAPLILLGAEAGTRMGLGMPPVQPREGILAWGRFQTCFAPYFKPFTDSYIRQHQIVPSPRFDVGFGPTSSHPALSTKPCKCLVRVLVFLPE